jgi:serine phosphatase RsbU (regulator of sigma subunit)
VDIRLKRLLVASTLLLVTTALISAAAGAVLGTPSMVAVAGLLLAGILLLLLLWLAWRLLHALLWRVGRRLAFSYLLIGVLPIPMVALLGGLVLYLAGAFFLGHLYRDAMRGLRADLGRAAVAQVTRGTIGGRLSSGVDEVSFARYAGGRRTDGDESLPTSWPEVQGDGDQLPRVALFALADGSPALIAAAGTGEAGVLARFTGDLDAELTRRSGVWVNLYRSDDPREQDKFRLQLGKRIFALRPLGGGDRAAEREAHFGTSQADLGWLDRPWLWWSEISGSLHRIEDGGLVSDYVTASLNGTPRLVARELFSESAELDAAVWAGLLAISGLLGTIYVLAAAMAVFIIFTLSRAVNRLSRATETVRAGDFSARIPVKRKDQVGELQRSFNQMAENLESLIATAAQKEILDNELKIARNLQKSLLPAALPASEAFDFATLFEPSAAIGGDYFDIFRLDESRLAVVIADVSGHGLPTGLRMAMLKAALGILVEDQKPPPEILRRLSAMIRADRKGHFFATASVAVIDFRRSELELTNAGHPPTYLLRDGAVEEILLPGNPLGALGDSYGEATIDLVAGDVLVWLSDGLIEAADPSGEPFGYARLAAAIAGDGGSAAAVRDRLVNAVSGHVGGLAADDDRTLVVMRYRVAESGASPSPSHE